MRTTYGNPLYNGSCYTSLRSELDSILEAVLTVSPNRQYLGMVNPTTPVTTGPITQIMCI